MKISIFARKSDLKNLDCDFVDKLSYYTWPIIFEINFNCIDKILLTTKYIIMIPYFRDRG